MMFGIDKANHRIATLEREVAAITDRLAAAASRIETQNEAIERLTARLGDTVASLESLRTSHAGQSEDACDKLARQSEQVEDVRGGLAGQGKQIEDLRNRLAGQGEQIDGLRDRLTGQGEQIKQALELRDGVTAIDIALRGLSRRIDIDAEEAAKTAAALFARIELGQRSAKPR